MSQSFLSEKGGVRKGRWREKEEGGKEERRV
jgi:hypothetical protein